MKLYYAPGACSLASHIVLEETGQDYEPVKVDLRTKQTEDGRDFKAINPKGYVPALGLDDGETLTENIAVLLYLADEAGMLIPAAGLERWRVIETAAFVSTELHKSFKPFFKPDATDAERDAAKALLADRFQRMEDRLGDRAFIVGEEMSIADAYLFVMLLWARKNRLEVPMHLQGYCERLMERPAVKAAMTQEGL